MRPRVSQPAGLPVLVLFVVSLATCLGASGPASPEPEVCATQSTEVRREAMRTFARDELKPLEALLEPHDLKRYRGLIKDGECKAAQLLLKGPYLDSYPEHDCLFAQEHGVREWKTHILSKRYFDLSLCFKEKSFEERDLDIKLMSIAATPFPGISNYMRSADRSALPRAVRWRNDILLSIASLCRWDRYLPACMTYIRLWRETDAISISDERAFLILQWAKLLGSKDPRLGPWQEEIAARLSKAQRTRAQEKARRDVLRSQMQTEGVARQ